MNAVYSARGMKRRYEVWFLRCGLADGSGAWWFRYLLMNLGRNGCTRNRRDCRCKCGQRGFLVDGKPQTFIQGYPAEALELSGRGELPFHFRIAENGIEENTCWGDLHVDGHAISWKLRNRSTFGVVLSDKGWIGFSKSPHSNAQFSGEIVFDGKKFSGDPLGFGVQGHNCGYRHRTYWRWMHAYFAGSARQQRARWKRLYMICRLAWSFAKRSGGMTARPTVLKRFQEIEVEREAARLQWRFAAVDADGSAVRSHDRSCRAGHSRAAVFEDGLFRHISGVERQFCECHGAFRQERQQVLETIGGAVLEMGGV